MLRGVKKLAVLTTIGTVLLASGVARAEASELDLTGGDNTACLSDGSCTQVGSYWYFAGALWSTTEIQPTGSGYIDSFLRIQDASNSPSSLVVDGMNTNGELLNDEKSGPNGGANFTHDVLTSDLQAVTIDGVEYYQFILDINQTGSDPLLTLSGLQLCQGSDPSLSFVDTCAGVDTDNPDTGTSTLKYDMASPTGDPSLLTDTVHANDDTTNQVLIDYSLNSGSGSGDLFVYIPTSVLPEGTGNEQLYLWSQFGAPLPPEGTDNNNDGYEEWAFLSGADGGGGGEPLGEVPEPGSLVLLGTGLLFGGHLIRKRSRKQQASKAE